MELHIANTFDKNRLDQFYVLLSSLFAHNQKNTLHFYVVATDIDAIEKEKLEKYIVQSGGRIYFTEIDLQKLEAFPLGSEWTIAVYYRLLLFLLLPEQIQKILYLDTDTLVMKDLSSFFQLEMGDFPIAAVYDNYVKEREDLGLTGHEAYFNSGVMLVELNSWKRQGISEKAIEYLKKYPERIKFVDQDALNAVLANNWLKLPREYNFMYNYVPQNASQKVYKQLLAHIVIIHFNLERPWKFLCKNRFRTLYYHYHRLSPKVKSSPITDMSLLSLGKWLRIRFIECYLDAPSIVHLVWRKVKRIR